MAKIEMNSSDERFDRIMKRENTGRVIWQSGFWTDWARL